MASIIMCKLNIIIIIIYQMSSSELQPRKVELMWAHLKNMTTVRLYTHNNGACKHFYWNTIYHTLVTGLYKITIELYNSYLMLNNLVVAAIWTPLPLMYRNHSLFLFPCILVKGIPLKYLWVLSSLEFIIKFKTSISNSMCLFHLHHSFSLKR